MQDHGRMKAAMQEFSLSLQEKYGEVNISLADGTISEVEKAVEPKLEAVTE